MTQPSQSMRSALAMNTAHRAAEVFQSKFAGVFAPSSSPWPPRTTSSA